MTKSLVGIVLCLALLPACTQKQAPPTPDQRPGPTARGVLSPLTGTTRAVLGVDQGWDAELRGKFASRAQGSFFMPLDWFRVIERDGDEVLFRDASNIEPMGYLVDQPSDANPDGLPLGLGPSTDEATKRAWVGLTCASCHLAELEYDGTRIRIEGGAGLGDINLLLGGMVSAMQATHEDDDKFARFAAALEAGGAEVDRAALRTELGELAALRLEQTQMNTASLAFGPGRLDAQGAISNDVMVKYLGVAENRFDINGPVSYPVLWDTPHFDVTQWNGSAYNSGVGTVAQNMAQVLGIYTHVDLEPEGGQGYPSGVDGLGLGSVQRWIKKLQAPAWPTSVLPPIDADKAAAGAALYSEHCASCHQLLDPDRDPGPIDVTMVPIGEVGTDPVAAVNYTTRRGKTGILEGRKAEVLAGDPLPAEASAPEVVAHVVAGVLIHQMGEAMIASIEGGERVHQAPDFDPNSYKARPLNGVWSSAPYLHNGSVPTLFQVLSPPEQRDPRFFLGDKAFDPEQVGYVRTEGPRSFEFDTTLAGNGNGGHLYGTDLPVEQRWQLVEYLKTL